MKESRSGKQLLAFCETYAADCFRLCLLDTENWDEAEHALRNAMLRFRRKGAAKKELVGAWNILAQETLRASKSFRADRIRSEKISKNAEAMARYPGSEAQAALFAQIMALPQWERDAVGLVFAMRLTKTQAAKLLKKTDDEVDRAVSFAPAEEIRSCLEQITSSTRTEKLVEALKIGASATPEYHLKSMTALVAVVMLLNAAGLIVLYRLVIAKQPNPDFFGEGAVVQFEESSEFTVLYNELLNELTKYDYNLTYYQLDDRYRPPAEQYPLFEGDWADNPRGTELTERFGYSAASVCGEGWSFAGAVHSVTVCRYTKVIIDRETFAMTPTNQEYIVWYDGQTDGMNFSQDRIYRIASTTAKFTEADLEGLEVIDPDTTAIEAKYPGCSAVMQYVKYWDAEQERWNVRTCASVVGDQAPQGTAAQPYTILEPTQNADIYQPGDDTRLLFYCDEDGTPLDLVTKALCIPMLAEEERNPSFYWEFTAERTRLRSVPELIGAAPADAKDALTAVELQTELIDEPSSKPAGTVIFCEPKAGSSVPFGTTVKVYISTGTAETE